MADENMVQNAVEPRNNNETEIQEELTEGNYNEEEFQAINAQLDQLNSVLDDMETQNDGIHAELIELLKSNRETRKQFQESVKVGEGGDAKSGNKQ